MMNEKNSQMILETHPRSALSLHPHFFSITLLPVYISFYINNIEIVFFINGFLNLF